jgi:hypothetical protein
MIRNYGGIDLSTKKSGFALINEEKELLYLDILSLKEVIRKTIEYSCVLVGIDAPLTSPINGPWRKCDKLLLKMGIPCLPPGAKNFSKLTKTGIYILKELTKRGIKCIEVYPYATRRRLGIATKINKKSSGGRKILIREISRVISDPNGFLDKSNHHELDAVISAYTAYLTDKGLCQIIGDKEGAIYIPAAPEDVDHATH